MEFVGILAQRDAGHQYYQRNPVFMYSSFMILYHFQTSNFAKMEDFPNDKCAHE